MHASVVRKPEAWLLQRLHLLLQVQQTSPHGKAGPLLPPTSKVTISELGERQLLARIRARLPGPPASVVVGIGDDAAVITPVRNAQEVLTTDASVEGVHFDRTLSSPADIGHRALAVNLSDLAAMGATPRWALLSLALPAAFEVEEVDGLIDGFIGLAAAHGVALIGGNLTKSPGPVMIDVVAIGSVRPRRVLTRAGGRPGDELFVSGTLGGAAAGLEMLREMPRLKPGPSEVPIKATEGPGVSPGNMCISRYRRPTPRVRLGAALAHGLAARAAMDLSDGLADGLTQIAEASGCGVEVDAEALPIDPAAREWWTAQGRDPVPAALTGGDDYELLIAVAAKARGRLRHVINRVTDPPLTKIGVLTRDPQARVLRREGKAEELPRGFEHW